MITAAQGFLLIVILLFIFVNFLILLEVSSRVSSINKKVKGVLKSIRKNKHVED